MSIRCLIAALVAAMFVAGSASAQTSARRLDPTADLLAKLRKPVEMERAQDISLTDFASLLGEKFNITALINTAAFRNASPRSTPGSQLLRVPQLHGASWVSMLPHILGQVDAAFLVRRDHIEFLPIAAAGKETKNLADDEDEASPRLAQPLVSMIFKEKPLNEAIAELADEYNLTVIVAPQSGDARTGFVTARLLNTPADRALELLAVQCDLRVAAKGNAFLITTRDHSNDLFNEVMERERSKIELEKLRAAPPMAPQPPQPQIQFPIIPVTPVPAPAPNPPAPPGKP
jgi:hypothetical protein